MNSFLLAAAVSYQIVSGLPLKHDGYVVEKREDGRGKREEVEFVVKAETERAFLYANYESNRWMNAKSYPYVRDPHFKFRALDVSRSPEPLRDWIAATGANAVYFKRGRPDAKRLRECAALGVEAYSFLYGCDAAKWNRARYDGFVEAHPSAKGVSPEKSWEKGTLCPSDPATAGFFGDAVREIAVPEVAGVVVCLWDDYGLNCVCERCKADGLAGNWGRQVAFAVAAWEKALKPLKKKLVVRTWSSGASHWLGEEWVHAPGYGGPSGEPLSVWGEAMRKAGKDVLFQTKVYNADCQPDPPFSALLAVAPRRDIAEWQITGQTVGRQYFPASVVAQTARQFARVKRLVSPEGGVMLYAGTYKRDGYAALSDRLNSVNIHVWRQLSWNPDENTEALWREWAEPLYGKNWNSVAAAMKASETASVASFSPLGLGAPTESAFAGNVARRESLLRYTNRYFLEKGMSALEPTPENVERVIAEKDAALSRLDSALAKLGVGVLAEGDLERFAGLRTHLAATRELDASLWRLRLLKHLEKTGEPVGEIRSRIKESAAAVDALGAEFPRDLGSPRSLMKDICSQAGQ